MSGRAPPGFSRHAQADDDGRDLMASQEGSSTLASGAGTQATSLPVDKLKWQQNLLECSSKADAKPLALLACGSFNPVTNQHLRMVELARYEMQHQRGHQVLGGYLSPVGNRYNKPGLAEARHRVEMTRLAVESSEFLMVDAWEAMQPDYVRTLHVLRSVKEEINHSMKEGGWDGPEVQVMLVCGADMLESFGKPGVWVPEMLRELLVDFGVVCVAREGTDLESVLSQEESLVKEYREHIRIVVEPFTNVVSSSKVREQLSKGRPLSYIVPDPVIDYIRQHRLYSDL